jgi:SAM-dependent methyltransferase
MEEQEFDRFAQEYDAMLRSSIAASGEGPEYFARYKISDMADVLQRAGLSHSVANVLDFGGGVGASLPYLSEFFPDAKITLADVSRRSLSYAAERQVPRVEILHFDGKRLPLPDNQFDAVIAACVFHHIPESEHIALMREIRRLLRPGGLFFIFEHNPWNPLTRKVVNSCPYDENAVLITGPRLRRRMQDAGFARVDLSWRIFFPSALRSWRPAERWLEWLPLGAQYRAVGYG